MYPTRRGEFRTIGWDADQLAERHGDVIDLLAAIVDGIARGDFMIAPWKESSACDLLRLQADLPARPGGYMERNAADDPRLPTFAERIRGVQ